MPFAPVIPLGGLGGWRFLERTQDTQQALFNRSPDIQREVDYFKENIGNITSSAELVGDRRLLAVALGAFGLSDEINKQAFVRTVIDGGTFDPRSFANRLGNSNYLEFAKTFSFGNEGGFVVTTNRTNDIVGKFLTTQFEEAVGKVDNTMRLALNFKREMNDLAGQGLTRDTGWLRAMGSLPIRAVLESAFNLPTQFSQIGLDQQIDVLISKTKQLFGSDSVDIFSDPEILDDMVRRFHLREQINNGPDASTPGFAALSILQGSFGGGLGAGGILNLFLSNT
ncbi:MAG: DUF1217 domain-containing protein [Robiginitomaculum sp.]|nr:DUF1217 domain-containing protein [Robiginitomaculum sp.]